MSAYVSVPGDWIPLSVFACEDYLTSAIGIYALPKPCFGATQPALVQPHDWTSNAGLPKPGCSAPPAKPLGWTKPTNSIWARISFLIHTINKHRAVIYRTGLTAVSEPKMQTTGYTLSIRLREQIHRDWLFFEINPKVVYPQAENFHSRHSLTFKLEVVFGGV